MMMFFFVMIVLYCLVLFVMCVFLFFFVKQKTAYEMRISDWSSDVCSSDLLSEWATVVKGRSVESLFEFFRSINYGDQNSALSPFADHFLRYPFKRPEYYHRVSLAYYKALYMMKLFPSNEGDSRRTLWFEDIYADDGTFMILKYRSEEQTSELQSLMRNSFAVSCLNNKQNK